MKRCEERLGDKMKSLQTALVGKLKRSKFSGGADVRAMAGLNDDSRCFQSWRTYRGLFNSRMNQSLLSLRSVTVPHE